MIIEDKILPGEELFKYVAYIYEESQKRVTPPLEESTKPQFSEDVKNEKPKEEIEGDLPGYCEDGQCCLNFSSFLEDEDIENTMYGSISEEGDQLKSEIKQQGSNSKNEKFQEVESDYDKMMAARNDMSKPTQPRGGEMPQGRTLNIN